MQQKFTADRLPQSTVRHILLSGYFYLSFDGCLLSVLRYAIALTVPTGRRLLLTFLQPRHSEAQKRPVIQPRLAGIPNPWQSPEQMVVASGEHHAFTCPPAASSTGRILAWRLRTGRCKNKEENRSSRKPGYFHAIKQMDRIQGKVGEKKSLLLERKKSKVGFLSTPAPCAACPQAQQAQFFLTFSYYQCTIPRTLFFWFCVFGFSAYWQEEHKILRQSGPLLAPPWVYLHGVQGVAGFDFTIPSKHHPNLLSV